MTAVTVTPWPPGRFTRHGGGRTLRRAVIGFAAVSLIALASPGASMAAKSACEAYGEGNFCLWQDSYYSPLAWVWGEVHHDPWGQYIYVGDTFNDKASSLYCYRNLYVCWVGKNAHPATQGGPTACIGLGASYSDLSFYLWPDVSGGANDTISSVELSSWRTSCPSNSSFVHLPLTSTTGQGTTTTSASP
jgi:hypothetical protein